MGTHPIFESDFDCLTDMLRLCVCLCTKFARRHQAVRILNQYPVLLAAKAKIDASSDPLAHELITTYFELTEPGYDNIEFWKALNSDEHEMLSGLTSILRDTIDSADPLHYKVYEEYFSQAIRVIAKIKDEFVFDNDGELRQLGDSQYCTKLATSPLIKPGTLSLSDMKAFLDENRVKLHIAHT